jgi:hypothetical protein
MGSPRLRAAIVGSRPPPCKGFELMAAWRFSFKGTAFGPIRDIAASQQVARYSITSSARPSNMSGNVVPSALAVLRLITSWTLVDY